MGLYSPPPGTSDIPGLEVAGEIIGGDLTCPENALRGFKIGDQVCALVAGGGYAEFCVAPIAQCLPLPKGWTHVEAAGLPETFFTVWSNLFDRAQLTTPSSPHHRKQRVLVHGGSSGIGTTAIQLAKAMGHDVIVTVGSGGKGVGVSRYRCGARHQLQNDGFCRGGERVHQRRPLIKTYF